MPKRLRGSATGRTGHEIERLAQTLAQEWAATPDGLDAGEAVSPARAPPSPARVVYDRSVAGGRSRELLEVIAGGKENGTLPAQLGLILAPGPGGKSLSKASVRAVIRNIQSLEGRLLAEGAINRRVVLVDFSGYEREGAGRYYIHGDLIDLDAFLGRA